jgi:hypothetical protein
MQTLMKLFLILLASTALTPVHAQSLPDPFSITLTAKNATVKSGTSVWVKIQLTNNSAQDLDESGTINGMTGADPNLSFDVRDEDGKLKQKKVHKHAELASGKPINRTIAPGQTLEEEQDVSRLFDTTEPGKYVIQVSRRVSDDQKNKLVKSNTITVTVTP